MEKILEYLKQSYEPLAIITYGSYGDGSSNEYSDFDALIITEGHPRFHDVSVVNGIQLDVFIYPKAFFDTEYNCEDFVQVFDGNILMDTGGYAYRLKQSVLSYINNKPKKSREEISDEIAWCRKMLLRASRSDAEGMFRWHWLLTDSLEIFCDSVSYPYFGPKKALKRMEKEYPEAFALYAKALSDFSYESLEKWIFFLNV